MPNDPMSALETSLARLRAELRAIDHTDTRNQARLAELIFAIKARLDPLKRAAGLLDDPEDATALPALIDELTSAPYRKRSTRRSRLPAANHTTEIQAFSDALAGIIDPAAAGLDPAAWMTGYRFGRKLRVMPKPE